jgi:hypothetical protein
MQHNLPPFYAIIEGMENTDPSWERERVRPRSRLPLYLLLNVIVSAITTLAVLIIWDSVRGPDQTQLVLPLIAPQSTQQSVPQTSSLAAQETQAAAASTPVEPPIPVPTATLPPLDTPVIQILSVIGPGDLSQEVVLLRRLGEGNLRMTGWRLESSSGVKYVFAEQPELILYKDGAVQIYSKAGTDTATEVYWNRTAPAWNSGETLKLIDPEGNERANYLIP